MKSGWEEGPQLKAACINVLTQVRLSTSITPELPSRHQRGKREASVGRRTGEEILGTKKFTSTGLSAGAVETMAFTKIF